MFKLFFKNIKLFIFNSSKYQSGMTLIELMVVLGIFVMITTITIFNYGSFQSAASMQNLSDDIALSVRKAQNYAIGASGISGTFTYGYGVHFSNTPVPVSYYQSGSNKSFVGFVDITGDQKYNFNNTNICGSPNNNNECNELLKINTADLISNIYINESSSPVPANSAVDIVFLRPDPKALICYRTAVSPNTCDTSTPISHIKVEISNGKIGPDKKTRYVTIWTTGQISSQ